MMTLTREQIAALKASAEAASKYFHPGYGPNPRSLSVDLKKTGWHEDVAEYLALCTPETILALLADRAAAEGPGVEARCFGEIPLGEHLCAKHGGSYLNCPAPGAAGETA